MAACAGSNDITVSKDGSTGTVTIRDLVVVYSGDNHRVYFPMVAVNNNSVKRLRSDKRLLFRHLTAGMHLTLTDTSATKDYLVGSMKIVTYGESASAGALDAVNGVSCSWEVQGPALPGDMMGSETGDVSMAYSSEMHFTIGQARRLRTR